MISGDTIAAIATAPGRGGVAVVRVSGPEAFAVAERLTDNRFQVSGNRFQVLRVNSPRPRVVQSATSNLNLGTSNLKPGTSNLKPETSNLKPGTSNLKPETSNLKPGTFIDEAVVLAFKSPRSYTGEDVVEFQCHGGAVTPRRVLEACLAAGARLAQRGEFTQRAFLNGKLDYDQAESVLDLIDAKTVRAADAALDGLSGRKRRELKALYEQALDLSAQFEHTLDFDENELPPDFFDNLASRVSRLASSLADALRRVREGKILRTGALVVLAGPPNAGKSSLMNALLEENRAIVSDVPGTTRDSIEEWLDLDGWPIRLVDTAGLREAGDAIEAEGVKRAEDLIAKADVVILLRSQDDAASAPVCRLSPVGCPSPASRLLDVSSKCDLGRGPGLNVSAKTGEGLDELKRTIVARLEEKLDAGGEAVPDEGAVAALHAALSALEAAGGEKDLVLLANAVRRAAERLGESIGATYSEDLLTNLFSRFCVGK